MRMVRKQVYISPEQERRLKDRAAALGVTESELIRRGIERSLRQGSTEAPDEEAWQDALTFMRERARIHAAERQRGWSREDLYERDQRTDPAD